MPSKPDGRLPILTKLTAFFRSLLAIAEGDLRKLRHDPYELFTRMIQPTIWLLIFGQAMANQKNLSPEGMPYLDFIAPGILAQSVLFISIFFGIALIWERDMGILQKVLVTPAPRSSLVVGRGIAAGIRGVSQVVVVYILSFLLGVNLRFDIFALTGVLAMVLLGAAIFSSLSLIAASIVKKRERFMGIGQVLTMPLFFASNALYPIDMMPKWIQVVSVLNPLTYQVDALRHLMVVGEKSHFGLSVDFGVSMIVFVCFVAIATRFYPKILY